MKIFDILKQLPKESSWQIKIRYHPDIPGSYITIYGEDIRDITSSWNNLVTIIASTVATHRNNPDSHHNSFAGVMFMNVINIPTDPHKALITADDIESDVKLDINLRDEFISLFQGDSNAPEYSATFYSFFEDVFGYTWEYINADEDDDVKL